jgi:hypothetical protein
MGPKSWFRPKLTLGHAAHCWQQTQLAGAREELAYGARSKWLNFFGCNLSTEF